jgi:hypothetical protein
MPDTPRISDATEGLLQATLATIENLLGEISDTPMEILGLHRREAV